MPGFLKETWPAAAQLQPCREVQGLVFGHQSVTFAVFQSLKPKSRETD